MNNKLIRRIYIGFVVLILALILFCVIDSRLNITKRNALSGYKVISESSYEKIKDITAPAGVREEYTFTLRNVSNAYTELLFYTVHQNAEVYVEQERIYSMRARHDNKIGRTPGCIWNDVMLEDGDADKTVRVVLYPVYKSSVGTKTSFYFGERAAIMRHIVAREITVLVLCIVGALTGIIFMGYILYNYRNSELDKNFFMLGFFALSVSLWKMTDLSVVTLIFPDSGWIYLMPLLMLQQLSIPCVRYMRELVGMEDNKWWDVPCYISLVNMGLSFILQVTGIRDYRETLWMTHVTLVSTALIVISMMYKKVAADGWSVKLKRNYKSLLICLAGMVIDLIAYYVSKGLYTTVMGILGFDIYILSAGAFFMQDTKELLNVGMKARNFERMAYLDQLTGLYNRTAFSNDTENPEFQPKNCVVAVFDLNNLKKCNDTLGHEKGDIYIKECAGIVKNVFGDVGRCYRMGGDEFCVLMENSTVAECKKRVRIMQEHVKKCNERYPEISMGIACGYKLYDQLIDYNINDTSRRADKMMYQEKYSMKEKMKEKAK